LLLLLLLQGLRDMCTAEGAVLCFDEVMTGFRIARGCAQVSRWTMRYN
jgi:glutamate-1-semialdehyde aminotransferase